MTSEMIFALLQLILQMVGSLTTNASVTTVVNAITAYLPEIEKAEPAIVADFQNIIADLTGNPNLTADQVAAMLSAKATLDARTDADIAATLGATGSAA